MEKPEKVDVWPQRKRFKELYDIYRKSFTPKKKRADVAIELELSDGGLYSLLYDKDRKPGLSTLQRAVSLFGNCKITEFVDDPSNLPPGLSSTADAVAPEECRVAMRHIYEHLKGMTPAEIQSAIKVWDATISFKKG